MDVPISIVPHLFLDKLLLSAGRATETVMTKVLADILLALDTSDLSMLTLLDLSAPFDTVNHQILIRRLDILRPWQRRVDLVQVVPRQLYSIHPLWQIDINFGYSYFRSSTGVGPRTDYVPAIHSRPVATDRATQSTSTRIRRRHPDLRLVPTVCYFSTSGADVCMLR